MAESPYRSLMAAATIFGIFGAVIFVWSYCAPTDPATSSATLQTGQFAPFSANEDAAMLEPQHAESDPQVTPTREVESGAAASKSSGLGERVMRGGGLVVDPARPASGPQALLDSSHASSTVKNNSATGQGLAKEDSAEASAPNAIRPEDIQRVLNEQFKPVAKRCYEQAIEQFPDAEVDGRVVVSFDIIAENGEGRVELAELGEASTLFDDGLHDCMLSSLGEVVFPAGDGKLRVNFPFNFAASDSRDGAE